MFWIRRHCLAFSDGQILKLCLRAILIWLCCHRRSLITEKSLFTLQQTVKAQCSHSCFAQHQSQWALSGPMQRQRCSVPTTSDNSHSTGCYALVVSAVLMSGFGGRIGGHIMPRVQLPAVNPKRKAWNKGRIIGQKRPLLPKQVWAIRARLELAGYLRDLALCNFCLAIRRSIAPCVIWALSWKML